MYNQDNVEGLLLANYVANFLESVNNLPNELQVHMSRLRELDVTHRECVRDLQNMYKVCGTNPQQHSISGAPFRVQPAFIRAQRVGEEKIQLIHVIQDLIDRNERALDDDYIALRDFLSNHDDSDDDMSEDIRPPQVVKSDNEEEEEESEEEVESSTDDVEMQLYGDTDEDIASYDDFVSDEEDDDSRMSEDVNVTDDWEEVYPNTERSEDSASSDVSAD